MRTEAERSQTVRVLQSDLLSDTEEITEEVVLETEMLPNTDLEEITREKVFASYDLSSKDKLSLEQGEDIMRIRLQELQLVRTVPISEMHSTGGKLSS